MSEKLGQGSLAKSKYEQQPTPVVSPQPLSSSSSSSSLSSPSDSRSRSAPTSDSSTTQASTIQDACVIQTSESIADLEPDRPANGQFHGHLLPNGWVCTYDSDNDQYMFEYQGENAQHDPDQIRGSHPPYKPTTSKSSADSAIEREGLTKDEAILAKTPTVDHVAQTSRRPTLNLFECQYGYHFPSSPTPSMISDLAKQMQKDSATAPVAKMKQIGYGKSKLTMLSDEEEQAKRLREMFPTATGPIVDQMIRIYHGREGLIKAALISLGYKRAAEYNVQQETAQSPIMLMMSKPGSKKLFEKLVSYFPDKDEALIKNLMYKHKEVEHEIISILVESGQLSGAIGSGRPTSKSRLDGHKLDKDVAIMKLRYLKFLFPTCDEIELYHLLYCNDLNAQKVTEIVEKKGHKRANIDEVMQNRKSQTQQMRAQQAALVAREKAPTVNPIDAHRSRTKPNVTEARANNMKENLKKSFADFEDGILLGALKAADYNETLAKKFLQEMEPIEEAKYKQRYEIQREKQPAVVLYPCKGVQKSDTSFMSIIGNDYVAIPKEVVECENALALLKVDDCTYTQDDFTEPRFTHAKGKRLDLAIGSIFQSLKVKESLRRGAAENLRSGSIYEQVCIDQKRSAPNRRALGRDKMLAHGRKLTLCSGHNPKLVQRIHPFFERPRNFFGVS